MTAINRQNSQLETRLALCVRASAGGELLALMKSLSNSDFRRAGMLLGEKVLPQAVGSSDAFWALFHEVVAANPKAYLGTFLKAAVRLYKEERLQLSSNPHLEAFAAAATPIDCVKTLEALLPIARTPDEVALLLSLFGGSNREQRMKHLLKAATKPAYHQLFELLRREEGDTPFLRQAAILLIRQNSEPAFRMASIVCQYFGLTDVPCTFSLQVQPYELSKLEHSYESFLRIFNK